MRATRLSDRPIVHTGLHPSLGDNICNPWMLRIPDGHGLGRYHLYFSHHKGTHLRLAFADHLRGPWSIHPPGVMDLGDSTFPDEAGLDAAGVGDIEFRYAHIASPQVIADPGGDGYHMYFHGLADHGTQVTRYAWSADGLRFSARAADLGQPYFRVAAFGDRLLAVAWGGHVYEADHWAGPFRHIARLPHGITDDGPVWRHPDIRNAGGRTQVLYGRIGDAPEGIWFTGFDPSLPPAKWALDPPVELLRPAHGWEGVHAPVEPSRIGAAQGLRHELRDGTFFEDADGQLYLIYIGGGESAIGIARLDATQHPHRT